MTPRLYHQGAATLKLRRSKPSDMTARLAVVAGSATSTETATCQGKSNYWTGHDGPMTPTFLWRKAPQQKLFRTERLWYSLQLPRVPRNEGPHIPAYGMLPLLLKRNLQLEPNGCNMIKLESFLLSRAYHSTTVTNKLNVRINEIHQKTGARVSRCFPKPIASLNDLVVQNQNPKIIPVRDTCTPAPLQNKLFCHTWPYYS